MKVYLSVIVLIFLLISNLYALEYKLVKKWGGYGSEEGKFLYPSDIAVDDNGYVYVSDIFGDDKINVFSTDGEFIKRWGKRGYEDKDFEIGDISDIATDSKGYIYIYTNYVKKFTREGKFIKKWTWKTYNYENSQSNNYILKEDHKNESFDIRQELMDPWFIALDVYDNLYVVNGEWVGRGGPHFINHEIQKFNQEGELINIWLDRERDKDSFFEKNDQIKKIFVDKDNNIYVNSYSGDHGFRFGFIKYSQNDKTIKRYNFSEFVHAMDKNGNFYTVDYDNWIISVINEEGKILYEIKVGFPFGEFVIDKYLNIYVIVEKNEECYIYKFSPTSLGDKPINEEFVYVHPNPAKESKIYFKYALNRQSNIEINIYNIAGELIDTIYEQGISGIKETTWHIPDKVASGVYLCQIKAISINTGIKSIVTKKLAIIR